MTGWRLIRKKKFFPAFVHALTYSAVFFFTDFAWWQIVLIGLQHYLQDSTQLILWFMKKTGSEEFATGVCSPWSLILMDNIIHILFIAIVEAIGKMLI